MSKSIKIIMSIVLVISTDAVSMLSFAPSKSASTEVLSVTDQNKSSAISSDSSYPVITSQETKTRAEASSAKKNVQPSQIPLKVIKTTLQSHMAAIDVRQRKQERQVNIAQRIASQIKEIIDEKYPKIPIYFVNKIVNDGNYHVNYRTTEVTLYSDAYVDLELYTQCIPILNSKERLKDRLTEKKGIVDEQEVQKILSQIVCEQIDKIKINWFISGKPPHPVCSAECSKNCIYNYEYAFVMRHWEKTQKLEDKSERKILEECVDFDFS